MPEHDNPERRRSDPDPRFPQPRRPRREPSVLDVTEGGSAGFTSVRWDGTHLVRHQDRDGADRIEPLTAPTPERWAAFWQALDRLDVWGWESVYRGNATDSYFAVEIEHDGRRVESEGQDSGYADNYDEFRRAVAELTGEEER